jgi:mannose-1-phosphate guanylyltransferase/mannose-1-phosphate guanylyltransferase/mannose-6-phosphate isomerase
VPSTSRIHPVLLSGGSGSRLWPLSRENLPKQFLAFGASHSLLQQAALRLHDPELFEPLSVIASEPHRFLVAQQMGELQIPAPTIILEPTARNTAAAAAVAALAVSRIDPEGLLLLAAADHRIDDIDAFREAVREAAVVCRSGFLVLFGIKPDRPATGYGYIRIGETFADLRARRVLAFVEKPDLATAEAYLSGGEHLWNSGIFLLAVATFLSEVSRYEPDLLEHAREALDRASRDQDFVRLDQSSFDRCHSISIDEGIMERSERLAVLPVAFGWTDVGSWSTFAEIAETDEAGNTAMGDVWMEGTQNSYVRSEGPLVATVGVGDLVVIATGDAVLVARKDRDQDVKLIVDKLRSRKRGLT